MVFYFAGFLCLCLAAGASEMTQREVTNFHPENIPIGTVACYNVFLFKIQCVLTSEQELGGVFR